MMTQKIRVFGYLSCLLCAGSVFAQIPGSVAPNGSGASVSGNSGGTSSVTPTGYTTSLLNTSVSGGAAGIASSIDASVRSSYTPAISDSLRDTPENNIPLSSNAGDRPSPFSAAKFPLAGASQFGPQGGFHGGTSARQATGETPKIASRLSEAQAWSGAGSKAGSVTDSGQISGNQLTTKLQNSSFSSQQTLATMGESQGSGAAPKRGVRDSYSASYTPNGFPDSAKGTAMLSPPEVDYGQVFSKSSAPTLSFAQPDMNNHEFLAPSLSGSARRAGGGGRSLERQMMKQLRNGSGSTGREGNSSDAMRKLASQGDIDQLRRQLKSPLARPLIKPLESESLRSHSIH
jgi:hypothetical protein